MLSIFCLGVSRTGTVSLVEALCVLGYKAEHADPYERFPWGAWQDSDFRFYDGIDAVAELPAILFWREITAAYPGCCKWILTVRDEDERRKSELRFRKQVVDPLMQRDDGRLAGDLRLQSLLLEVWDGEPYWTPLRVASHNHDVLREATRRPDVDLLVMDLTKGDGWDVLCPFLGKPVPDVPFPHVNATKQ